MSLPVPALYMGTVRHRRFRPRTHAFSYPLFMAFLDVERLDELCGMSDLLARNAFAWASFHDADHLGDPELPFRERLRMDAEAKGHRLPDGPIFLLTHLRYLGYGFNPVSYFYCYDPDGTLALVCAEVNNMPWRERHTYWMAPAQGVRGRDGFSCEVPKAFHVSPFLPMDGRYRWAFTDPGAQLKVHIAEWIGPEFYFDASLELARHSWDAATLRGALLRFPWMTLQIVAAIHWEALRLWLKRVPVYTHPKKLAARGN